MIKHSKKVTGEVGERFTEEYLKKHGYKILERNYRKPYGEIDIIAHKDNTIAFVEVKTRHINSLTQPYEAVDFKKQKRLIKTAAAYLSENHTDSFCRFDVSEVFTDSVTQKPVEIHYIKNAFEMGEGNAYY